MMNQDFEQVVKNTFEHFEADVNPQVWTNIQQGLQGSPPAGQSPAGSGASGIKAAAVLSKTAAVITTGVVVVATGLTIWYFAGNNVEKQPAASETVITPANAPANTITAVEPVTATNATAAEENQTAGVTANSDKSAPVNNKNEKAPSAIVTAGTASNTAETPVVDKQPALTDNNNNITAAPAPKSDERTIQPENKSVQPAKAEAKELIQKYNNEPLAFISANPVIGNAPLAVSFANTGYASSVKWDFGDGAQGDLSQTSHTFKSPGKYRVRLTATDKDNKVFADEIEIIVKDDESAVHSSVSGIQNVFTPNGDGYNDVFRIDGSNLSSLNAMIFDASGKMIYQWTDPEGGWDGLSKGKTAEGASYYYIIEASGKDGKVYRFKGTVRLIR